MKSVNYLILVVVFFLSACSGGSTPSDAAKKMTGYLQSQNYEKFVDGMLFDKNISADQAAKEKTMMIALLKEKAGKEFEKKKGIKKIDVLEESIEADGQTAVVKVKYLYGDDSSEEHTLFFRKVENDWKLFIKK